MAAPGTSTGLPSAGLMGERAPGEVWCPTCGARPGDTCLTGGGRPAYKPHGQRVRQAEQYQALSRRSRTVKARSRGRGRIPPSRRAAVAQRSGGRCEAATPSCHPGPHPAEQIHHIRRRAQGGANGLDNLLHVCGWGHAWIHAHPADAAARGLLQRTEHDG